jgi:hypothetical protein
MVGRPMVRKIPKMWSQWNVVSPYLAVNQQRALIHKAPAEIFSVYLDVTLSIKIRPLQMARHFRKQNARLHHRLVSSSFF